MRSATGAATEADTMYGVSSEPVPVTVTLSPPWTTHWQAPESQPHLPIGLTPLHSAGLAAGGRIDQGHRQAEFGPDASAGGPHRSLIANDGGASLAGRGE